MFSKVFFGFPVATLVGAIRIAEKQSDQVLAVPMVKNLDMPFVQDSTLRITAQDEIEQFEEIGEGVYGRVFKLQLNRGKQSETFAVKFAKATSETPNMNFEIDYLNDIKSDESGFFMKVLATKIEGLKFLQEKSGLLNDVGTDQVIVSAFRSHGSLEKFIYDVMDGKLGKFQAKHAMSLLKQMCTGLSHLHTTHKIAHGDVRPANVMLLTSPETFAESLKTGSDAVQLEIIDFGLAAGSNDSETFLYQRREDTYGVAQVIQEFADAAGIADSGLDGLLEEMNDEFCPPSAKTVLEEYF